MFKVLAIRALVISASLLLPYLSWAQLDYNLLQLNADSLYEYNGSLFDGVAEWKNSQDSGQVIIAFHFRSGSVYNHEFVYMEKGSVLVTAYYNRDKKQGELKRFDKKGVLSGLVIYDSATAVLRKSWADGELKFVDSILPGNLKVNAEYYPSGQLKVLDSFTTNHLLEVREEYYDNGSLKSLDYANERVRIKQNWDEAGDIISADTSARMIIKAAPGIAGREDFEFKFQKGSLRTFNKPWIEWQDRYYFQFILNSKGGLLSYNYGRHPQMYFQQTWWDDKNVLQSETVLSESIAIARTWDHDGKIISEKRDVKTQ